jgi:hypothetical protein
MAVSRMAFDLAPYDIVPFADGNVMVAGGEDFGDLPDLGGPTWEVFEPAMNRFRLGGALPTDIAVDPRVATRLPDGRVLFLNEDHSTTLFDPEVGTFARAARTVHDAFYDTAVSLADGRVLFTGGQHGDGYVRAAEIYDPGTASFAATGSMGTAREGARAVLLRDGRVLVIGGDQGTELGPHTGATDRVLASAELFDPATGRFSPTGSMHEGRTGFAATLLPDGRVLVTGGLANSGEELATAEVYDPAAGAFSRTGQMTDSRFLPVAVLLPEGRVLITGGDEAETTELFDPASGSFSRGPLESSNGAQGAFVLVDGRVLIAAGDGMAQVYTP